MHQIEADRATAAGVCFLERLGIDASQPDGTKRLLEQIRQLEDRRLEQARKENEQLTTGGVR
jgi:hypothetical protein